MFEIIIGVTRNVLSNDDIKSMLMQKDSNGLSVLHGVAQLGDDSIFKKLNSFLRAHLSDDEIRSLLLEVSGNDRNCFRFVAINAKISLQLFCETVGNLVLIEDQTRLLHQLSILEIIHLPCRNNKTEDVPVETIKHLLTKKDQNGLNAFQVVASNGYADKWNRLITFAQARFSSAEMKSFLFCCTENGESCLHLSLSSPRY